MSIKVMNEVFDRYPRGGGEMLLALALADHASDDGSRVFPSIKALSLKTRQSVRAVQYQLRAMEESGWIILQNEGNGGRNQTREYRISLEWIRGAEIAPLQKDAPNELKGATDDVKGATGDTKGCNQLHPHITTKEPSGTINPVPASGVLDVNYLVAEGVEKQHAIDWLRVRKEKRAPLTLTAWEDVVGEAKKAGITPAAAVKYAASRSWQGFKASWYAAEAATGTTDVAAGASARAESMKKLDELGARLGLTRGENESFQDWNYRLLQAQPQPRRVKAERPQA